MIRPLTTNRRNQTKRYLAWVSGIATIAFLGQIGWQISHNLPEATIATAPQREPEKIITQQVQDWPEKLSDITITANMIKLTLDDQINVSLSKKKSLSRQLEALQLIINQSKINGKIPKEIDLRFNNPIATY